MPECPVPPGHAVTSRSVRFSLVRRGQHYVKDGVLRRVTVSYADELRPLD
jgi:hypothetical protein